MSQDSDVIPRWERQAATSHRPALRLSDMPLRLLASAGKMQFGNGVTRVLLTVTAL